MFSSLSLALSTKSLADMSCLLEKFFSPVVISMITTPKLYNSDRLKLHPYIDILEPYTLSEV